MKLLLTFFIARTVCIITIHTFLDLIEPFFLDSTTLNSQGADHGTQYRSAIFYHSPEQKSIAERVTAEVQEKHLKGKKIVTEIAPATTFYDAERYHQVNY